MPSKLFYEITASLMRSTISELAQFKIGDKVTAMHDHTYSGVIEGLDLDKIGFLVRWTNEESGESGFRAQYVRGDSLVLTSRLGDK